jgi:hypothetical protein
MISQETDSRLVDFGSSSSNTSETLMSGRVQKPLPLTQFAPPQSMFGDSLHPSISHQLWPTQGHQFGGVRWLRSVRFPDVARYTPTIPT